MLEFFCQMLALAEDDLEAALSYTISMRDSTESEMQKLPPVLGSLGVEFSEEMAADLVNELPHMVQLVNGIRGAAMAYRFKAGEPPS